MTLIEVLIVVAILSLLSAGIAVAVVPMWTKAQIDTTIENAHNLRSIVLQWRVVRGSMECPTFDLLLRDRAIDAAARRVDAWNEPFRVYCDESDITVTSFGPDRREGTADDIVVPAKVPRE